LHERSNIGQAVKYRPLLGGPMATAKNAPCAPSEARPERLVSHQISHPGATAIGGARNGQGSAPGSARIRLGSAPGWGMVAPRSALDWALGWALSWAQGRAQGWATRPRTVLGSAPRDKRLVESELVLKRAAPSLRIRFQSTFPYAHISASLAPMIVGLAPMIAGLAPVVGGLVPRETVLGRGRAVAPLTGGRGCRT
jgi:hypothetical protein